jgi:2-methylcitrate dehydratase PrpD
VIGADFRISAPLAALANGTMGHALDYDDVHWNLIWHPSVALLPSALAMAELQGGSGADLITAYVLGLELACRIGSGITKAHYERGWHTTSTLGSLGAAVAAAKMLKLDQGSAQQALGLAASLAGGLRQNFGTMTKPFHAGNAARNGVIAATLAHRGFTADPDIIESPLGFCRVFCGEGEYELDKMVQDLGHTFQILDPGITLKPYPSCAGTHQALDAILSLVEKHDIVAEAVDSVNCAVSYLIPQMLIHHRPASPLQAKFSMEYCLAVALIDRRVGVDQFLPERIREEGVQQLLRRVHMRVHPELSSREKLKSGEEFAKVTIRLRDGCEFSRRINIRRGDPRNPLSKEELLGKYRECAARALPAERVERSIDQLARLETLTSIKELVDVLS